MCFGGNDTPAPAQTPAPPPPPPADTPSAPVYNESNVDATNAKTSIENSRRGRSSLLIKRPRTTATAPSETDSGLQIPT